MDEQRRQVRARPPSFKIEVPGDQQKKVKLQKKCKT